MAPPTPAAPAAHGGRVSTAPPGHKGGGANGAAPPSLDGKPCSLKFAGCRLADFEVGAVLGTGSFGRVSLARHRASGQALAIKALSKAHIVRHQQIAHLRK